MRITIDIPPDIEEKLYQKCDEAGISPSEFINALIEWYFLKRKKKTSPESHEFINTAIRIADERKQYCKYSDGTHCALEVLDDIFEEKKPEPITPYKCLFCLDFTDRRKKAKLRKGVEVEGIEHVRLKVHEIAKLAAKYMFEMYGDKLGYHPKLVIEEIEEAEESKEEEPPISRKDVSKLLRNW
jgi:hypothetical protein